MAEHFGDILKKFVEEAEQNAGRLSKLTGIPRYTIVSWLEGRVKRPRNLQDIVELAAALRLFEEEADQLLQAAKHTTISELIELAKAEQNEELLSSLAYWLKLREKRIVISPADTVGITNFPPFHAPSNITNFVGRRQLLKDVKDRLLERELICVLQGMGGVGKTALATQIAYELRPSFPEGVLWANLSNIAADGKPDPVVINSILGSFARALGLDISEEKDLNSRSKFVLNALTNKKTLIILDNVQSAAGVTYLLPALTGNCAVLITTRNQKILRSRAIPFHISSFAEADSLKFLMRIIGKERVEREGRGAKKIIELLGGLPLAIKIAASNLVDSQSLTLLEYYELLSDEHSRLEYLADWDDISKNVGASFELSFKYLPENLKHLFSCLAVFAGSDFSIEAVATIVDETLVLIKQHLGRLQALSLVEENHVSETTIAASFSNSASRPFRYSLHPLLQIFALKKLGIDGDKTVALFHRAATYFINFVEENYQSYHRLDIDWKNITAALNFARQNQEWNTYFRGVDSLTTVNLGIIGFLDARGYWQEAVDLLETALNSPIAAHDTLYQTKMRFKLGAIAFRQADMAKAETNLQQSVGLVDTLPEDDTKLLLGQICEVMAQLTFNRGEVPTSLTWSERGLNALQKLDLPIARHEEGYLQIRRAAILAQTGELDVALEATQEGILLLPPEPTPAKVSGLLNIGIIQDMKGNAEEALAAWKEGVENAQALGDSRRLARLWQSIGAAKANGGYIVEAIYAQQKALALNERMGDVTGAAYIHSNLGEDYILLQDYESAQTHLTTALEIASQHKLEPVELYVLVNQARWQIDNKQLPAAEVSLSQADTLGQQLELAQQNAEIKRLLAELAYHREEYELALEQVKEALVLAADPKEKGLSWRLRGDIYGAMAEPALAEEAYQQSQEILDKRNPFECAKTQLAWGQYYANTQASEKAKPLLKAALAAFERLEMNNYAATAKTALGWDEDAKIVVKQPAEPNPTIQSLKKEIATSHDHKPHLTTTRFVQKELIAAGGQGEVYRGQDSESNQQVIIKRLKPELATQNPEQVARFLREAEVLRQLDHPNIVKMLAAQDTEEGAIIVMEYVAGGSLRDLLQKQPQLPLPRVLDITLELADALIRTHHLGIIHRDLKPGNVLLAADGTPRLTDFGLAYMTQQETHLTQEGAWMGTVVYSSPEAFRDLPMDTRSDIWSFGVMLFEMLTGQLPFASKQIEATIMAILNNPTPDIFQFRSNLPLDLEELIEKMLVKEREKRIGGMRQVAAELEVIRDQLNELD